MKQLRSTLQGIMPFSASLTPSGRSITVRLSPLSMGFSGRATSKVTPQDVTLTRSSPLKPFISASRKLASPIKSATNSLAGW